MHAGFSQASHAVTMSTNDISSIGHDDPWQNSSLINPLGMNTCTHMQTTVSHILLCKHWKNVHINTCMHVHTHWGRGRACTNTKTKPVRTTKPNPWFFDRTMSRYEEHNRKLDSTAPLQKTKWHWLFLHTKIWTVYPCIPPAVFKTKRCCWTHWDKKYIKKKSWSNQFAFTTLKCRQNRYLQINQPHTKINMS